MNLFLHCVSKNNNTNVAMARQQIIFAHCTFFADNKVMTLLSATNYLCQKLPQLVNMR